MEILNELIQQYIKPELLILIPVLWGLGAIIKHTNRISNTMIPLMLGFVGIFLSLIWCFATTTYETIPEILSCVFTSITQGILVASVSVYGNQFLKQLKTSPEHNSERGK